MDWVRYFGYAVALAIPAAQFVWPANPNYGKNVDSRPPPWFFGVIWSIILVVVGTVWLLTYDAVQAEVASDSEVKGNWVYGGLALAVALCVAWMGVYAKNRKGGVYIMWLLIAVLIMTAIVEAPLSVTGAAMLAIPIVWATYAANMNMLEVQSRK